MRRVIAWGRRWAGGGTRPTQRDLHFSPGSMFLEGEGENKVHIPTFIMHECSP